MYYETVVTVLEKIKKSLKKFSKLGKHWLRLCSVLSFFVTMEMKAWPIYMYSLLRLHITPC